MHSVEKGDKASAMGDILDKGWKENEKRFRKTGAIF